MKKTSSKKQKLSKLWIFGSILALLAIGGLAAGVRYYPQLNQGRLIKKSQDLLAQKDFEGAMLTARRALQLDERNPEVVRLLIQITKEAKSPAVLTWKQRMVDLEPDSLENHLSAAETALSLGQPAMAEEILLPIPHLGRQSAKYHELNAKAALAGKNLAKAEVEFAEALKLNPGNIDTQFGLYAVQLQSPDSKTRVAARTELEKLLTDYELFPRVSRILIDDALRRGNGERAMALAENLQKAPGATFADRITYLELLYRVNRASFPAYLTVLQAEAVKQPQDLATLIVWLTEHNSAMIATDWCKRLSPEELSVMPVPVAVAQAYAKMGDWAGIKPILLGAYGDVPEAKEADKPVPGAETTPKWGDREFLRLAFLAAVHRFEGDLKQSKIQWNAAVKAASDRPAAINLLARYAVAWDWDNESSELLWKVAKGTSDQMWALSILYQNYERSQSASNLLQVAMLIHQLEPKKRDMANNVAFLSLLLETNMSQALKIAGELHKLEPQNPDYLATYAFALHLEGQTQAAVDLMRTLGPEKLKEPTIATYFAVILAATGANEEAATYLDFAKDAKLLPEEKKLVARAREQLAKPR